MTRTPGAWSTKRAPSVAEYSLLADGELFASVLFHTAAPPERQRANARLMAAAPELLAALRDCADRLSGVSGVSDPIGRARTAIALATGEES